MRKAGGVALGLLVAGLGLSPLPAQTVAVPAAARSAFRWTGELSQGGLIRGQAPAGTVAMTLDGQDVPLTPDGAFLIGFDRDAGPAAELVATLADGRQLRQSLTVAPRAWRIERIDRPVVGRAALFLAAGGDMGGAAADDLAAKRVVARKAKGSGHDDAHDESFQIGRMAGVSWISRISKTLPKKSRQYVPA